MIFVFELVYLALLCLIALYGLQRAWLAGEHVFRGRRPSRTAADATLPAELADAPILVQLPVYNDGDVFVRLLDSLAETHCERARLEVQVLDDSDDGSSEGIAARVAELREGGWRIEHLRRDDRSGYKAGALAAGLRRSSAPFVAIFDSDFVVPPDFFTQLLPEFRDRGLAYVQARWGFSNEGANLLTRVQALMLDAHFRVEHRVRSRAGRFFNFNGTAGIWRRSAIDDAGGWRSTSITEDLDLSLRAWLRGWGMRLCDDVVVASDLPTTMRAFRTQQNRWISGSMQIARSMAGEILASRHPLGARLDALLAISGNVVYPLILCLLLALPHAIAIRLVFRDRLLLHADVPFFLATTLSVGIFYWRARGERRAFPTCGRIAALMAIGLGMTLHNARAVVRGLRGRARVFERTPKGSQERRGVGRGDRLRWGEGALLLYLATIGLYAANVAWHSLPLIGLFVVGTALVLLLSFGSGKGSAGREEKG